MSLESYLGRRPSWMLWRRTRGGDDQTVGNRRDLGTVCAGRGETACVRPKRRDVFVGLVIGNSIPPFEDTGIVTRDPSTEDV